MASRGDELARILTEEAEAEEKRSRSLAERAARIIQRGGDVKTSLISPDALAPLKAPDPIDSAHPALQPVLRFGRGASSGLVAQALGVDPSTGIAGVGGAELAGRIFATVGADIAQGVGALPPRKPAPKSEPRKGSRVRRGYQKVYGRESYNIPGRQLEEEKTPIIFHSVGNVHDALSMLQQQGPGWFTGGFTEAGRPAMGASASIGSFTSRPEMRGAATSTRSPITFVFDTNLLDKQLPPGKKITRMKELSGASEGSIGELRAVEQSARPDRLLASPIPLDKDAMQRSVVEIQIDYNSLPRPENQLELTAQLLSLHRLRDEARKMGIPVVEAPALGGEPGKVRGIPTVENVRALITAKFHASSNEAIRYLAALVKTPTTNEYHLAKVLNGLQPKSLIGRDLSSTIIGPGGISLYAGEGKLNDVVNMVLFRDTRTPPLVVTPTGPTYETVAATVLRVSTKKRKP